MLILNNNKGQHNRNKRRNCGKQVIRFLGDGSKQMPSQEQAHKFLCGYQLPHFSHFDERDNGFVRN